VKPMPFNYIRARSLDQILALLQEHGEEAKILAGGQSLIPAMNMRFAAPEMILDISSVEELQGIQEQSAAVRIGSMCRLAEVLEAQMVKKFAPLIAMAIPHIAHSTIRNQGTFGGSMCQADPASELPACALALDASFNIRSALGTRAVQASDFFQGTYATCLADDEILVSVDVPRSGTNRVNFFQEVSRRQGDYAIAGLAASAIVDDGRLQDARLVFFGVAEVPVSAAPAECILMDTLVSEIDADHICSVVASNIAPLGDLTSSGDTKLAIMQVLLRRALDSFANRDSAA